MAALVAVLLLPGGLAAMCGEPDAAGRSIAHYHQHKNAGIVRVRGNRVPNKDAQDKGMQSAAG